MSAIEMPIKRFPFQILNGEWKENLFIYMKRLQNIWRDLTDLVRKELMGLEAKTYSGLRISPSMFRGKSSI